MALSVVYVFQMIGISQDNGHAVSFAIAARAHELALQNVHSHAAIPQTCEGIVPGLEAHLFALSPDCPSDAKCAFWYAPAARIERLGQVIVRTRFQSCDDIFLGIAGR